MQVSNHTLEQTLKSTHTQNSKHRKYSIVNFTHNISTSVLISYSAINQACRSTLKYSRKKTFFPHTLEWLQQRLRSFLTLHVKPVQNKIRLVQIGMGPYLRVTNGLAIVSFAAIFILNVVSSIALLFRDIRRILSTSIVRARAFSIVPFASHFSARFFLLEVSLGCTIPFNAINFVIVIFSLLKISYPLGTWISWIIVPWFAFWKKTV